MCAEDNFYFWGAISRKTGRKYAVRTVNHGVGLRTDRVELCFFLSLFFFLNFGFLTFLEAL